MLFRSCLPDVIIQLANFVETGQSAFTSAMLARALGFFLGVGAAVAVAAIFSTMRTSVPHRVFAATGVLFMAAVLIQQSTALVQILVNTADIELSDALFSVLVFLINHGLYLVIAQAAVFIIPAAVSVAAGIRISPTPYAPPDFLIMMNRITVPSFAVYWNRWRWPSESWP